MVSLYLDQILGWGGYLSSRPPTTSFWLSLHELTVVSLIPRNNQSLDLPRVWDSSKWCFVCVQVTTQKLAPKQCQLMDKTNKAAHCTLVMVWHPWDIGFIPLQKKKKRIKQQLVSKGSKVAHLLVSDQSTVLKSPSFMAVKNIVFDIPQMHQLEAGNSVSCPFSLASCNRCIWWDYIPLYKFINRAPSFHFTLDLPYPFLVHSWLDTHMHR